MQDEQRITTYRCVSGHEIPNVELELLTEEVSLDGGALVRICREHGCPIAQSVSPPEGSRAAEARR